MTLTIGLKTEVEKLLRLVAKERGISLEDVVASRLDFSAQALEEEELEDELDVAEAERLLATTDFSQRKTLDDLRTA